MTNKEIINTLKLHAQLLELHGENHFKTRSYITAASNLEGISTELAHLSIKELENLEGIGKAIAQKIADLNQIGTFKQFDEFLKKTPKGIIDMFEVNGLGIKKIQKIWKELGIEDTDQLLQACKNNQIAGAKGFGLKTQENIKKQLLFQKENSDKIRMDKAEKCEQQLTEFIKKYLPNVKFQFTGEIIQYQVLVSKIQLIIASQNLQEVFNIFDKSDFLEKDNQNTGLFTWRGFFQETKTKVEVIITTEEYFISKIFIHSSNPKHLAYEQNNKTLLETAQSQVFANEADIYQKLNLPFITAPMREGVEEFDWIKTNKQDDIIQENDLKGILHAHSTYSDGKNTLLEMAEKTKAMGYEYLGITDHSKSAFYANGLYEYQVIKQHKEIDEINQKLTPFYIFKGIESDILQDGSLDYDVEILKSFDFIIASIHSGLGMDMNKATQRLINAIENPHTHMLGHPTGRLLLKREGYAIDYKKVIDACAANEVSIEINASPWRLDLDWRLLNYAIEKSVWISINPDAHSLEGIKDTRFGVKIAQKVGLSKEFVLNTKSKETLQEFF